MLTEKTVFKSASWLAVSAILERVELFLIAALVAKFYPRFLGRFYFALLLFHVIGMLFNRLLSTKIIPKLRNFADKKETGEFATLAAYSIKVYFIVGIILATTIYPILIIIAYLSGHPNVFSLLVIFALATPFFLISLLFLNILRFLQKFRQLVIFQVIGQYGAQLLFIFLAIKIFHWGILAVAWANFLGIILFNILALPIIFQEINLLGFFQKIKLTKILPSKFGVASSVFALNIRIAELLIPLILGFRAFGTYVRLVYWPLLLYVLPTTIFSMFLHVLALKVRRGEENRELTFKIIRWMAIIATPLLLILLFYPAELSNFLFRNPENINVLAIRIFAVSFYIQTFTWITGRILIAHKKLTGYLVSSYFFLAILLSLFIILTPIYHLNGAAASYLTASITEFLLKYRLVIKDKLI